MFIGLKPLSERDDTADQVIARLRKNLASEPGATLFLQSIQDIRMGGRMSNASTSTPFRGITIRTARMDTQSLPRTLQIADAR